VSSRNYNSPKFQLIGYAIPWHFKFDRYSAVYRPLLQIVGQHCAQVYAVDATFGRICSARRIITLHKARSACRVHISTVLYIFIIHRIAHNPDGLRCDEKTLCDTNCSIRFQRLRRRSSTYCVYRTCVNKRKIVSKVTPSVPGDFWKKIEKT